MYTCFNQLSVPHYYYRRMNPAERIRNSEIEKIQHIDEVLEACRG